MSHPSFPLVFIFAVEVRMLSDEKLCLFVDAVVFMVFNDMLKSSKIMFDLMWDLPIWHLKRRFPP